MNQPRVLFVEQRPSSRAHIAEALLRHYGDGRYEVYSASLEPGLPSREAADVLAEQGINADRRVHAIDELRGVRFDYVIEVGSEHESIDVPIDGAPEKMRWRFLDPRAIVGDRIAALRRIRDEILNRVRFFILTDREY
jgi:protein-tyrosine-phosphatase